MRDPAVLRTKAATALKNAASAETPTSAAKLEEVARQLELWANDLERQARAAAEYRRKAVEMRELSDTARDPVIYRLLLVLACEYARLAEHAEAEQGREGR